MPVSKTGQPDFESIEHAYSQLQDNLDEIRRAYAEEKSDSEQLYGGLGNVLDRWQYNMPSDLEQTSLDEASYRRLGRAFAATEHILDNEEEFRSMMGQIEEEIFHPEGEKINPSYAAEYNNNWSVDLDPTHNLFSMAEESVDDYSAVERAVMEISDAVNYVESQSLH